MIIIICPFVKSKPQGKPHKWCSFSSGLVNNLLTPRSYTKAYVTAPYSHSIIARLRKEACTSLGQLRTLFSILRNTNLDYGIQSCIVKGAF